ncbi:GNAT family N-acetyltransferase [Pontibacter sp. 172403-2]|uniref:GNAT family N-acetyltransferase n=1 Tax=Pontibacter rufus TaxID=2791028 RepID=UPI0018AF9E42|nr:GNAT family N-acetyltransferase [Pontibacter sp. 172403-2]MBF9251852.1 GNAT family N-acetyltransferase [Pontibacter sp. 172403-2]
MTIPENNNFHFRKGTLADAELLADLGWRTFEETFAAFNRPEDMAAFKPTMYTPELQTEELCDSDTEFVIAEVQEQAVAYVKLNTAEAPEAITGRNPLQISRLYLLQKWTGRGLGDKLMQLCLEKARRNGHDVVWLTVWEHNERAKRFYRKYGFKEAGELTFILGSDVQRDLYMQREV